MSSYIDFYNNTTYDTKKLIKGGSNKLSLAPPDGAPDIQIIGPKSGYITASEYNNAGIPRDLNNFPTLHGGKKRRHKTKRKSRKVKKHKRKLHKHKSHKIKKHKRKLHKRKSRKVKKRINRKHSQSTHKMKGGYKQLFSNQPITFGSAIGGTLDSSESALANPPPYKAYLNCQS